jgi:hypothetical protein
MDNLTIVYIVLIGIILFISPCAFYKIKKIILSDERSWLLKNRKLYTIQEENEDEVI